jgi:hypothetical protein
MKYSKKNIGRKEFHNSPMFIDRTIHLSEVQNLKLFFNIGFLHVVFDKQVNEFSLLIFILEKY